MTTSPDHEQGMPATSPSGTSDAPSFSTTSVQTPNVAVEILRLLRKHWLLLFGCLVTGLIAASAVNVLTPREYTAGANLQLTPDSANQFRLEQAVGGDIDSTTIDTALEVLRSSTLALQTISSLHLDRDSHFTGRPSSRAWDMSNSSDRQVLISVFASHLIASRLGHTTIIQISFVASDPHLAANICNELIKNYREHVFKDNYAATEEVSSWLQAQLGTLRERLDLSQGKLLALQRDIGMFGVDQSQNIGTARIEGLSRDLTQAETARLVLQARLVALKSSPDRVVDTLSEDPLLLGLRQHQAQLADEYAGLISKYGAANPRVIEARLQMVHLDQALREEEGNAIHKAEKELSASMISEGALRATLKHEQEQAYSTNSKVLTYSLARREYDADRTLYDGLQAKLQEAGILAGLHSSSSRVIDAADVPSGPSRPRRTFNLMTGLLAGLTLGIIIALLIESLDTHIRTISEVEDLLGLALLGVIPRVGSKELDTQHFIESATQSLQSGWSRMAEAYRSLRTALLLSRPGSPPQVILVSSSLPAEGKTSVASFEAILLAISGARVLLVDADLRRPSIHHRFGITASEGLSSVLTGRSTLDETLCAVPSLPSLSILIAGPAVPMPAELLASSQMRDLILILRSRFDYILIDTPPALTVTDTSVLCALTDGAIIVLRYATTSHNEVTRTSRLLSRAGAPTLGVVINAADPNSSEYSDYSGGSYGSTYAEKQ